MDKVSSTSYMFGNGTGSVGDMPRAEWLPSKTAKERIINPQALTVCRYYTAGNCRRGSSCHYMHPPLVSMQEEYPSAEELDVHPLPQCEGWYRDIFHGFTAFPTHTTAQHTGLQCFNASRDVLDNFSDFSSSNDSVDASDQSLNTTFKVMTISETAASGPFRFYHSGFSQPSRSLQHPNNTVTRHGNVAYPGYYRGDTLSGSNARDPTHIKSNAIRKKSIAYKTKPCKFFSASKSCSQGDKCTFIHDVERVGREKMTNSQDRETTSSHLPQKPRSPLEDFKARNFYPITWRVIGGGVMMGGCRPPCRAFAAGHCPDGTDCKLAHETELKTPTSSVVELGLQPSLYSSAESKRRGVSLEHSDSNPAIQGTYEGISDGTEVPPSGRGDREELSSAGERSSAKNTVSSSRRRSRSMSLPSSPSVLSAPRIFAEL